MNFKFSFFEKVLIAGGIFLALAGGAVLTDQMLAERSRPDSTPVVFKDMDTLLPWVSMTSSVETSTSRCPLTLGFVGDIMQHREQMDDDFNQTYAQVRDLIAQQDLSIGMLEFPVMPAKPPGPAPQSVRFNGSPGHLQALAWAGFDILSTANNHAFDQGIDGVSETLRQLSFSNLRGVGTDADAAKDIPLFADKGGHRLAFAAFTFPPNSYEEKGDDYAGWLRKSALHPLDFHDWQGKKRVEGKGRFSRYAQNAQKNHADYLIALVHWGDEWDFRPSEDQRRAAQDLIDAGFDLVVGSHAHVLNGIEFYKGKLIAYSLGDFVSDFIEPEARTGALLRITLAKTAQNKTVLRDYFIVPTLAHRDENHEIERVRGDAYFGERAVGWSLATRIFGPAVRPFQSSAPLENGSFTRCP